LVQHQDPEVGRKLPQRYFAGNVSASHSAGVTKDSSRPNSNCNENWKVLPCQKISNSEGGEV